MDYRFTMDSFGEFLPENWEEIADFLNGIMADYEAELTHIDEFGMTVTDGEELLERQDKLWNDYCNGDIPGAPEAK